MRLTGKKVGKFRVVTVLAEYNLDVRLDMEKNVFTIHVPSSPGGEINTERGRRDYESFHAPTLEEVKKSVGEYLHGRDKTDFVDVIEYNYAGTRGDRYSHLSSVDNFVGFDFRVARVSTAKTDRGRAKLEIPVEVDEIGNISVEKVCGEEHGPISHNWTSYPATMAFTVERWRKCCAIRDGIAELDRLLFELLGGEETERKLDALRAGSLSLPPLAIEVEQFAKKTKG